MVDESNAVSSSKIYQFILKNISDGNLKPADRIREQDLVKKTGFSRTPIREALSLLLNEGILTQDGKNGLLITELDLNSITKLYEMRELLEGEAARLAVEHASNAELDILEKIVSNQIKTDDLDQIRANNILFHQTLYRCACNPYLLKIMKDLDRSLILLGESTLSDIARQKEAYNEHLDIVKALKEKNAKKASEKAKFHIAQAYKIRLNRILNLQTNY